MKNRVAPVLGLVPSNKHHPAPERSDRQRAQTKGGFSHTPSFVCGFRYVFHFVQDYSTLRSGTGFSKKLCNH